MKKWFISAFGASLAAVLVLACLGTASCEKYILPHLESNVDTIWAPAGGGLYDVTISSNVRWMFDPGTIESWVNVDIQDGSSDYAEAEYPLKVKVKANDTGADRECVMTFTSATLSRNIVVEQKGGSDN